MPTSACGRFTVEVLVGGEPLKEYEPSAWQNLKGPCDGIVEANFNTPGISYPSEPVEECDPFGEKFTQSWPVTPFKVRIAHAGDDNYGEASYWAKVYVDGTLAAAKSVATHGSKSIRVIDGYQARPGHANSEERDFCFSRPRLLARGESKDVTLSEAERLELSSIKVELHPCTFRSKDNNTTAVKKAGSAVEGVNKAAAKKGKVGAAARSGKVLQTKAHSTINRYDIDYSQVAASIRIRYAPKNLLRNMVDAMDDDSGESSSSNELGMFVEHDLGCDMGVFTHIYLLAPFLASLYAWGVLEPSRLTNSAP